MKIECIIYDIKGSLLHRLAAPSRQRLMEDLLTLSSISYDWNVTIKIREME